MTGEHLRCSAGATASTFANAVAASGARVTALHSAYPVLRRAQDRYVAPDAFASATEAMTRLVGLSKNPVLAPNTNIGPSLAGCISLGHHEDGRLSAAPPYGAANVLSDRLGDGRCHFPASRDARAVLKTPCAFPYPHALKARTKRFGVTSCSTILRLPSEACLSHVAAYVYSIPMYRCDNYGLAFAARNGRPGEPAPCTKRER